MLFKRIVSRDWSELEMISEDRSGFLALLGHIFTLFFIDFMFNIQSGSKSSLTLGPGAGFCSHLCCGSE